VKSDVLEREIQFDAPDLEAAERWLRAQPSYALLTFEAQGSKIQNDTYLDTDDWSIFRAGYSLRVRHREGSGEVTLKELTSRDNTLQQRREISQALNEYSAGDGAIVSVSERVRLLTNEASLNTLFSIETERSDFSVLQDGRALAVLSLDAARVLLDGEEARSISRVEIEETEDGGLRQIEPLIGAMQRACSFTPSPGSKFEAGLEAAGLSPQSTLDFGYAFLSPDATTGEYAYVLLRQYFREFLTHEPGTRLGEDPEELHDMRVATRKLRAAISLFESALPFRFLALRDELKWIGRALGEVRELDVYLQWLARERERSDWANGAAIGPVIEDSELARLRARENLLGVMRSERYAALVEDMKKALRLGDNGTGESAKPIQDYAAAVLPRRFKRLRKAATSLGPDSAPEEYHRVRVLTKRTRYGLDALRPLFPKKAVGALRAKQVQDSLGEYQDCAVAISRLRSMIESRGASLSPLTLFRTGELAEQCRARMTEIQQEWPARFAAFRDGWRPLAKQLRKGRERIDAEDDAAHPEQADGSPAQRPPVQRPFWWLQRFFRP
jgi:CHAD domain-containing protein